MALDKCRGLALVGYTDLHGGLDSAAAWRDPLQLCLDLAENPDQVRRLVAQAMAQFEEAYAYFDGLLQAANLPSVTWMALPSFGKMHIPSCDFAALISPACSSVRTAVLRRRSGDDAQYLPRGGRGVEGLGDGSFGPGIQAIQLGPGHGS